MELRDDLEGAFSFVFEKRKKQSKKILFSLHLPRSISVCIGKKQPYLWTLIKYCSLLHTKVTAASIRSICVLTRIVLLRLHVHSSWPRLSYADSSSSSRQVSVFVCSVLLPLESKSRWAIGVTPAFSQNRAEAARRRRMQQLQIPTSQNQPSASVCLSASFSTVQPRSRRGHFLHHHQPPQQQRHAIRPVGAPAGVSGRTGPRPQSTVT